MWLGVMAKSTAWQRKRRTDIQDEAERGDLIRISDPIEWTLLAEVLTKSDKVTELDVEFRPTMGTANAKKEHDNGAIQFAEAFVRSQTVEKLWMHGWRLHSSSAKDVLENALRFSANSTRLRVLSLQGTILSISKLEYWTRELSKKYPLEELHITYCKLCNDHVSALVAGLKTNRTLKSIDFSSNSISDNGAMSLAGLLTTNTTLESLLLNGNKINPIGAVALVSSSKRLKILDLSYNDLDNIGGACTQIATALKGNKSLTKLELDGPGFFSDSVDEHWLEPFIEALWFNTTCTDIYLTYHSRSHSNHIKLNRLADINDTATSPEEALAKKIEEFGPASVRTQEKRVVDEAWRSFLSGIPNAVLEEELCMRKTIDIANAPDGASLSLEPDGSGRALQHQIEQATRLVEVKQEKTAAEESLAEAKDHNQLHLAKISKVTKEKIAAESSISDVRKEKEKLETALKKTRMKKTELEESVTRAKKQRLEAEGSLKAHMDQNKMQAARLVEVKQERSELEKQAEEAKETNAQLRLDLEKVKECVVCQDGDKCVVLFPCSHLAICADCEPHINSICPICRGKIEKSFKVNIA